VTSSAKTLYQIADAEIRRCIDVYLGLAQASKGLSVVVPQHLTDERARIIVLAGLGIPSRAATPEEVHTEWQRRHALPFDLETALTAGVYSNLRAVSESLYEEVKVQTHGFTKFDAGYLVENPHVLPLLQHHWWYIQQGEAQRARRLSFRQQHLTTCCGTPIQVAFGASGPRKRDKRGNPQAT